MSNAHTACDDTIASLREQRAALAARLAEAESILRDFSAMVHSEACSTDGPVRITYGKITPYVMRARMLLARAASNGGTGRDDA